MSLSGLASRHRVARTYRTDSGERVEVGRDTIVAVLGALGVDTSGRGWITRELRAFDEAASRRLVEPVVVAWNGALELPPSAAEAEMTLTLEDGTTLESLPPTLPFGYHHLHMSSGGDEAEALVISAPVEAWHPPNAARRCGVYAPTFALHHAGVRGPGTLGHLNELIDWVVAHGGDTVLTLPLLASFLDDPQEISPYSPVSRLMWNELYADVGRAVHPASPDHLLDYRTAADDTRVAIQAAANAVDDDPVASRDLAQFLAERPDVDDYALFRGAQARHGRQWREWPAAARGGQLRSDDVDRAVARYHHVAQWLVDRQLAELHERNRSRDVLVGLDLAIGTHPDGYDVWRHASVFSHAATTGAPPDTFFVGGQDWGFPPLIPAAARASGYDYFRRAIAHHLRHASLLRIDHVMGLNRVYWVPAGAAPTEGTYVEHAGDELFAIACLESHRAEALLIGEDLGTVPPATRRAMRRHQLLGTWVVQGALESVVDTGDFDRPPRRCVASLNTHDMPTFAGYLQGADIDDRVDLGQIDADTGAEQHEARARVTEAALELAGASDPAGLLSWLLRELGASPAEIVLVNVEDLWLEPCPHNVPGTSTERPNWQRPMRYGVDELDTIPGAGDLLEQIRASRAGARSLKRPS